MAHTHYLPQPTTQPVQRKAKRARIIIPTGKKEIALRTFMREQIDSDSLINWQGITSRAMIATFAAIDNQLKKLGHKNSDTFLAFAGVHKKNIGKEILAGSEVNKVTATQFTIMLFDGLVRLGADSHQLEQHCINKDVENLIMLVRKLDLSPEKLIKPHSVPTKDPHP
jgi:hypothetical protein